MASVKIHYRRPPDRVTVYENELVYADDGVIVTIMRDTPLQRPVTIAGQRVLEDGAPAIWFTFPDADYDVARFHTRDGDFTGIYGNVLTPVEFVSPTEWRTTDLFVDLWINREGDVAILDEDELQDALARGWIDQATARSALTTAQRLADEHAQGTWPPRVVYDWPLERILGIKS